MIVLTSALAFLILLTLLILIHELGHFLAARMAKVTVEEFGFGLPPRAKTLFVQRGTKFTLNWIPFGGFVRLKGENPYDDKVRTQPGSIRSAPFLWRVVILVAGVFMNFILAMAILVTGFTAGQWIPTYMSLEDMENHANAGIIELQLGVLIEQVLSGGPASKVGVPERSLLSAINGVPVTRADEVARLQDGKSRVTYTVGTGEDFTNLATFTVDLKEGKSGIVVSTFPRSLAATKRSFLTAVRLSVRESKIMMEQTILGIGRLFSSLAQTGTIPEGITGVVGIAQLTHASVQQGFMTYLRLIAVISLSLAALNILPFPALDGGRLLFVVIEAITRRPMNKRFEVLSNAVGISVLLLLIFLITFYDIYRLF